MMSIDSKKKQWLVAGGCLAAIAFSGAWIYFTQFARPDYNEPLHQGIGQVMAEETAKLLANQGKIVILSMEPGKAPELKTQLAAFERALKKFSGIRIKETMVLDTEGRDKYGPGAGLSSRRFVRIVKKSQSADAIVSFVGAPNLSADDVAQLERQPKFIAESRSAEKLKPLFESNVLHAAIVSRFQFPAPGKHNPRTPQQWFEKRYQVVTATNAAALP